MCINHTFLCQSLLLGTAAWVMNASVLVSSFLGYIYNSFFDVIYVTETWLNSGKWNNEIFI